MTAVDQCEIQDGNVLRDTHVQPEPLVLTEGNLSKLSSLTSSENDDNDRPWTVMSKGKNRKSKISHVNITAILSSENKKTLTEVQDPVVIEAEKRLTNDERNWIQNWYQKVHNQPEVESSSESEASKGEGPSKGKSVDPGNWGVVDLAPDKLDVGAQEAALASYKEAKELLEKDAAMIKEQDIPVCTKQTKRNKKASRKSHEQSDDSASNTEQVPIKKDNRRSGSKLTPMSETVAGRVVDMVKGRVRLRELLNLLNKPVNQITTNSYLGKALQEVQERLATQDAPVPSSGSSNPSDLSPSDLDSDSEG
jgi:hypothetical protein